MFQLLLHPVADLRPLLPDVALQRLARPMWPAPAANRDFLRSSGSVKPRLQGGVDEWAGEDNFADASLAARFPDRLREQVFGQGALASQLSHVFRRFYSAGIVSRYEFGFRVTRADPAELAPADTARWLGVSSTVPMRFTRQRSSMALLKAGDTLARHYHAATTNRKIAAKAEPWWVVAGEPALIVEYAQRDAMSLLPHARTVSSARVGAEVLHHAWLEFAGQRLSTWLLRSDAPGCDREELRKLRIHLLRLHTEQECMRIVLDAAMQQRLGNTVPQADALQDYLEASLPTITRPVSHGVEQSQMLDVASAAWTSVRAGQAASFAALGRQVENRVARFVRRSQAAAPVITQIIETQMNTHIQLGNVTVSGDFNLVTAHNIQGSFNKAADADIDAPLKESLKTLSAQVAELAKKLSPEAAEAVSKDLAALTAEAVSKQPRKPWYELSANGLLEAAKTVAEMAAPVTTAVKAVLSLLA